jgi:hypothetical protein
LQSSLSLLSLSLGKRTTLLRLLRDFFLRVLGSGAVTYSFLPPQLKRVSGPYLNTRKYLPFRKEHLVISFTSTLCCAFFLAACTAYLEGVSTVLAELLRNYSYSEGLSEIIRVAATARAHSNSKKQRPDAPMIRDSEHQIAHQTPQGDCSASRAAICSREWRENFLSMLATWLSTVRSEITSFEAICRLLNPCATRAAISFSRRVR